MSLYSDRLREAVNMTAEEFVVDLLTGGQRLVPEAAARLLTEVKDVHARELAEKIRNAPEASEAWDDDYYRGEAVSEIADFLRARITERRALAVAASHGGEGRWSQEDPDRYPGRIVDERGDLVTFNISAPTDEQAAHIAANDPKAVIADCDAKLWIVNAAEKLPELTAAFDQFDNNRDAWERTLRLFAQPFVGHPDHKGEEWAP